MKKTLSLLLALMLLLTSGAMAATGNPSPKGGNLTHVVDENSALVVSAEMTEQVAALTAELAEAISAGESPRSILPEDTVKRLSPSFDTVSEVAEVSALSSGETNEDGSVTATISFPTRYEAGQPLRLMVGLPAADGAEDTQWKILTATADADGNVVATIPASLVSKLEKNPALMAVVSTVGISVYDTPTMPETAKIMGYFEDEAAQEKDALALVPAKVLSTLPENFTCLNEVLEIDTWEPEGYEPSEYVSGKLQLSKHYEEGTQVQQIVGIISEKKVEDLTLKDVTWYVVPAVMDDEDVAHSSFPATLVEEILTHPAICLIVKEGALTDEDELSPVVVNSTLDADVATLAEAFTADEANALPEAVREQLGTAYSKLSGLLQVKVNLLANLYLKDASYVSGTYGEASVYMQDVTVALKLTDEAYDAGTVLKLVVEVPNDDGEMQWFVLEAVVNENGEAVVTLPANLVSLLYAHAGLMVIYAAE